MALIQHVLCADIGGTHSRFAHFTLEGASSFLCRQYMCPTASLKNTQDALEAMHYGTGLAVEKAHVHIWGVAGLIGHHGREAHMTNNSLQLNFTPYAWAKAGENFFLLNDFALQAWASLAKEVPLLPLGEGAEEHCLESLRFTRQTHGILGAGTGLGAAALVPYKAQGWALMPTEAGHMDMSFHGKEEQDFARFARHFLQQERLSVEDVLCARALSVLHAYVHEEEVTPAQAAAALWGKSQNDLEESIVLQLYARFLGRFCRHWVLSTLCTGGLYFGGGVLLKNPAIVLSSSFREEFYDGPAPMQNMLRTIPMGLMQHDMASLWGAVQFAKDLNDTSKNL